MTKVTQITPEPLLRVGDVAEILSVSRSTVYRLVKAGLLNSIKIGACIRFRPEEVQRFLDTYPGGAW